MTSRSKKIEVDNWLDHIGYYRKHIAMDETCLFRAVSEQLFASQTHHETIRRHCIDYAIEHKSLYCDLVQGSWEQYLDNLKKHMVLCGDLEMHIISDAYKRDFIVFDSVELTEHKVTNNGFEDKILLCKLKDKHYDAVYSKEHIENAGFCQAIVYKMLYEEVLQVEDTDKYVQLMLHDDESSEEEDNVIAVFSASSFTDSGQLALAPPFPYKVAKALDPNQYRNTEFDAWNQIRKEVRIKNWYQGGVDFKVGVQCQLETEDGVVNCWIQEMLDNKAVAVGKGEGKEEEEVKDRQCVVHVVEKAERRTVSLGELRPHPSAKAWPLPFWFNRNCKPLNCMVPPDTRGHKNRRSKQNKKKRSLSEGAVTSVEGNNLREFETTSNTSLAGCPLVSSVSKQLSNCTLNSQESKSFQISQWEVPVEQPVMPYCGGGGSSGGGSGSGGSSGSGGGFPTHAHLAVPLDMQLPPKSVQPNGSDLPYHDVYTLRYYFNMGVECVRQNYQQMWSPVSPAMPEPYFSFPPNPQMMLSTQYDMSYQNTDTKYTFCKEVIKETFNLHNNNNVVMPNFNYEYVKYEVPGPDNYQQRAMACPFFPATYEVPPYPDTGLCPPEAGAYGPPMVYSTLPPPMPFCPSHPNRQLPPYAQPLTPLPIHNYEAPYLGPDL